MQAERELGVKKPDGERKHRARPVRVKIGVGVETVDRRIEVGIDRPEFHVRVAVPTELEKGKDGDCDVDVELVRRRGGEDREGSGAVDLIEDGAPLASGREIVDRFEVEAEIGWGAELHGGGEGVGDGGGGFVQG